MNTPVTALSRVESERLIRNPAVWVAFALTGWWVGVAMWGGPSIGSQPLTKYMLLLGYGFAVPGLVLFVAVVFAVLRGRMEHTEELLGTLAVGNDRRSVAHALANLGPAVVVMLTTLVMLAVIRPGASLGTDFDIDGVGAIDIPRPTVAQMLQGPVALLAFTTLAVALVRWIPSWLVIVPTPFLLLVQVAFFGLFVGTATSAANWLGVGGFLAHGVVNDEWVGCGEFDARCDLPVSDRIVRDFRLPSARLPSRSSPGTSLSISSEVRITTGSMSAARASDPANAVCSFTLSTQNV